MFCIKKREGRSEVGRSNTLLKGQEGRKRCMEVMRGKDEKVAAREKNWMGSSFLICCIQITPKSSDIK